MPALYFEGVFQCLKKIYFNYAPAKYTIYYFAVVPEIFGFVQKISTVVKILNTAGTWTTSK